MSIETTTYIRKPLYVEAVQVSKENFVELSLWCQGEIIEPDAPGYVHPVRDDDGL